jgi:hypothetical protein
VSERVPGNQRLGGRGQFRAGWSVVVVEVDVGWLRRAKQAGQMPGGRSNAQRTDTATK